MSNNSDIPGITRIANRGIQILLVAHGASLLTLVTTYIKVGERTPTPIHMIIDKLALGLLLGISAVTCSSASEIFRIPPTGKIFLFVSVIFFTAMVFFALISLLCLASVIYDVRNLPDIIS